MIWYGEPVSKLISIALYLMTITVEYTTHEPENNK